MMRRCSFMTSSYSRTRLRIRKFCSSTLRWAFSICFDSILDSIGSFSPSSAVGPEPGGGPEAVEHAVDAVARDQPHGVVLGGQKEARLARIALAAGTAAALVVDP